jgi:cell division protein FtsL
MIREFNEQWEKDYVRKTAETLQAQTVRRKRASFNGVEKFLRAAYSGRKSSLVAIWTNSWV